MRTDKNATNALTGKHVMFMVAAFFGVILVSNAFMITKSVTSFRGEDTKKSYLQGLHYNDTLDRRAAQRLSGWTAELAHTNENIDLMIRNENQAPVGALILTGVLRHPTDTAQDHPLEFTEGATGRYLARIPETAKGQRVLITKTKTDDEFEFETRNTIWLQ